MVPCRASGSRGTLACQNGPPGELDKGPASKSSWVDSNGIVRGSDVARRGEDENARQDEGESHNGGLLGLVTAPVGWAVRGAWHLGGSLLGRVI